MKDKTLPALLVTAAVMLAACSAQSATPPSATPTPTPANIITQFPLSGSPNGITAGPDGNLWVTEKYAIGRITPTGQITVFAAPQDTSSVPEEITAGPDGNLWFTDGCPRNADNACSGSDNIGRSTPTGHITEFPLPTNCGSKFGCSPEGITTGPDRNIWFTEHDGNQIGRITPTGQITEFPLPQNDLGGPTIAPTSITAGPDGNLWFIGCTLDFGPCDGGMIGRITPTGQITAFPISTYSYPNDITVGPDGNLWFTECTANSVAEYAFSQCKGSQIGRITPTGHITQFDLLQDTSDPEGITAGPDGNLWFTESDSNTFNCWIGRITPDGHITDFPLPRDTVAAEGITAGSDGNLWFTESNGVGRITPGK